MNNEFNNNPASSLVTYVHGSTGNVNSMKSHVEDVQAYKNRGILEGRSSGSDIEGYEGNINGDNCSDNDEDLNEISAFKREPTRKSLKSDHLNRWIDMQESYSEVTVVYIVYSLCGKILNIIYHNSLLCNISNTRKSVSSGYPNAEKCVEKRGRRPSFLTTLRCLDILMKHSSSCLI